MDILTLLACCSTLLSSTSLRHLAIIAQAVFSMTGPVTMLGISRWTEKGGSYRTVQRFFAEKLEWTAVQVKFFETHLFNPEQEYILAGDETIVSKSGYQTFGIDRFYSSLRGQVIRSLGFLVFSMVSVSECQAYPLMCEQRIKEKAVEKPPTKQKKKRKGKRGRPAGSRNKDKKEFKPSSELKQLNEMLKLLVISLRRFMKIKYLALDGHFGHQQAVLMAQQNGLELISKLRKDTVLYEKYEGENGGKRRNKKYGTRLRFDLLPPKYLQKSEREGNQIHY
jgi:putative transposase